MGRYTGPKCRLCRREGVKLFLKGAKCFTEKCPVEKRPYPPGMNRSWGRGSLYQMQLREKQKAKRIYGIREEQFKRYVEHAKRKKGITGLFLLEMLERRLDNVVYRGGFAASRDQARQLVTHGHFTVNDRSVNIPSYQVSPGDVVKLKEAALSKAGIKTMIEANKEKPRPSWLIREDAQIRVIEKPRIEEEAEQALQTHLIVEFYSR